MQFKVGAIHELAEVQAACQILSSFAILLSDNIGSWFGMNVLLVCVCGLLLLRFNVFGIGILRMQQKQARGVLASSPALSNKALKGTCLLPCGAPNHRR